MHNITRYREPRNYYEIYNNFAIEGIEAIAYLKLSNLKAVSNGKILTVIVKIIDMIVQETKEGKYFIIFHEQA